MLFHSLARVTLALMIFIAAASPAQAPDEMAASASIEKEDFFREGLAPVRKTGPYDLTIVYFMDYQCPSCRQYTPDVARVLKEDRRLRVIYRDTPLLGPESEKAAELAIASQFQGRHEAFHHALMMTRGRLNDAAIRAAADKAGVDWARLQRDLKAREEEIALVIARNLELSAATGIAGTPAFIVGERLADGALTYDAFKAVIADARRDGAKAEDPPATPATASSDDAATLAGNAVEPVAAATPTVGQKTPVFNKSVPQHPQSASVERQRDPVRWPWLAGLAAVVVATFAFARHRAKLDARRRNQ